jgi:hypothetical protein
VEARQGPRSWRGPEGAGSAGRPDEPYFRNPLKGDFKRTLGQDLKGLYSFYVDEERRARLAGMRPFKAALFRLWWLFRGLLGKLSAVRRTLLALSLLGLVLGAFRYDHGDTHISFNFYLPSAFILLVIIMLELKDKLVVREEMMVGRAVQLALLPDTSPELPGWEIWIFSRPANDVGGDLADCLSLGEGRLGLALGDVAGKGLGAALLMAKLQATLRAIAPDFLSLAELGARVNRIFCRDCDPSRFATLVYVEIAADNPNVRVLNAGHPPPVIVRASGTEDLAPVSLPIGVLPSAVFAEQEIRLQSGDCVLLYSDGLTEARAADGTFFGEERLCSLLARLRGGAVGEIGVALVTEVDRFLGETRASDDLSLILLRPVRA